MLLGSLAVGVAGCLGTTSPAHAAPLAYDEPAAFDVAERAYLAARAEHNEGGGYAWGASYYLLGLLRMYEAYGNPDHLDRFGREADRILASTDEARGVTDWAGRSGKVWRAAGAYTASHGTVPDAGGNAVLQLRWAGSRPAEATAEISEVVGDTFTVTLRTPTSATAVTLTGATLDPASDRYVVDLVNAAYTPSLRWTAKELRAAPAPAAAPPAATVVFEPQFYVFAVHTGMITHPLARYARMVLADKGLSRSRHGGRAHRIVAQVRQSVAFHDSELVMRPDGTADYVWPAGAPLAFDGLIQPYNQSHGLGQTMAELFRITGHQVYADRVRALLTTFAKGLTETTAGGYVWSYWPVHSELHSGYTAGQTPSTYTPSFTPAVQAEDISHGAISIEFAVAAQEAGIVDWDGELGRFGRTFSQQVIRSATEVWNRVDGTTPAVASNAVQCARWMPLVDHEKQIRDQSLRVYRAVELVPSQGSHALGIAYLNWARQRG